MKIILILLCLRISISKARPISSSEPIKVSERTPRAEIVDLGDDFWRWNLVPQDNNKISDSISDSEDIDLNHHSPGNVMFIGATSIENKHPPNFLEKGAMKLRNFMNKDKPHSDQPESSDIKQKGKKIKEVIMEHIEKDRQTFPVKVDQKGKGIINDYIAHKFTEEKVETSTTIGGRLKAAQEEFFRDQEEHAERFVKSCLPILNVAGEGCLQAIRVIAEILGRVCYELVISEERTHHRHHHHHHHHHWH